MPPQPAPQPSGGEVDDFYRLLNISKTASPAEIKDAIRRELRVWTNRTNAPQIDKRQYAERMVKLLEEAEAVLLDPTRRQAYDQKLSAQPHATGHGGFDSPVPNTPGPAAQSNNLVEQGWQLLIAGNIHDALYLATLATQQNNNDPEAWALLGEAHFRWGNDQPAIAAYQHAVLLRPNEPLYYFDLGSIWVQSVVRGRASVGVFEFMATC